MAAFVALKAARDGVLSTPPRHHHETRGADQNITAPAPAFNAPSMLQ